MLKPDHREEPRKSFGQLVGRIGLLEPCTCVKSKTGDRRFRVAGCEEDFEAGFYGQAACANS